MAFRVFLLAAAVALAGCSHRDKAPTPDDPTPTSPLDRTDTLAAQHGAAVSPR